MATDNTGTANSPYDAVTIETIAGEIQAGPLNTSLGNLDTAVQSHAHPLDTNVGWDSMKSSFRPPDTGDSTNRWRLVSGSKSINAPTGTGFATIIFATDADQGDPSFTATPTIWASAGTGDASVSFKVRIGSVISTLCAVHIENSDSPAPLGDNNVDLYWMAYGKVA